ncbi:lytic murein transglycosylase [Pseudaeromonas paramecii]|uniref:Lytic murein transglycosylase n=1 Tax=Pseudaeromonas paramecii TaxID=2138166 RepID=A0ABP8PWX8_9GAMM
MAACLSVQAQSPLSFQQYVQALRQEALAQGIRPQTLATAFADVHFIARAVKHDRSQPEHKLTLDEYLPKAVPAWKIKQAKQQYQKHRVLLTRIGAEYGVAPRFIVALWGIETNFGKLTGGFPLISSLTTLAYEGRREAFFKQQLFAALQIIDEGHIPADQMIGSWAGAMGQVQFMPTSFLRYAQDGDGDGRKDLWHSQADVFASAANYLHQVGWQANQTWGRAVTRPKALDAKLMGLEQQRSLAQWQALGVRNAWGGPLPKGSMLASLIQPDDGAGRSYLVYDNYRALMHWNRSHYFALAVSTLADAIVAP